MALITESIKTGRRDRYRGLIVIGNGPAFLQMVIMLKERDVLALTNNDADNLTLNYLGFQSQKIEFTAMALQLLRDSHREILLITSTTHSQQILRSLSSNLRKDHVLLIAPYPKMKKGYGHGNTFYMDTEDQFDKDLWHRAQALYRLSKMGNFIASRKVEGQRKTKILIVFFGAPDPDAIASGLAFSRLFSKDSVTTFAATGKVSRFENRALLSYLKVKIKDLKDINTEDYQVKVCLDAQPAFFQRAGWSIDFDICIDHHPEAEGNPNLDFLDVRKNHGSCSTILGQYFRYSKKVLPKTIATALLVGIKTDTNNFTRNVGEPDINILKYLYGKGDKHILRKLDFAVIPQSAIKYYKRAYTRYILEAPFLFCHLGKVGYPDIGSIIAEHFLKVQKVQVCMVSCISKGRLIAYIRSKNNLFHSGHLAQRTFMDCGIGGGHAEMGRAECELVNLPYPLKAIEMNLYSVMKNFVQDQQASLEEGN